MYEGLKGQLFAIAKEPTPENTKDIKSLSLEALRALNVLEYMLNSLVEDKVKNVLHEILLNEYEEELANDEPISE